LETDVETQSTENVEKAPENTSHKCQKTPTSAPISSRDGPYQRKRKLVEKEEIGIMKSLAEAVLKPETPNDDEDDLFGRFIAGEMKCISNPRIKLSLKQTISNAVFNAKMQQLQEQQPLPYHHPYPQHHQQLSSSPAVTGQPGVIGIGQHLAGSQYSTMQSESRPTSRTGSVGSDFSAAESASYLELLHGYEYVNY